MGVHVATGSIVAIAVTVGDIGVTIGHSRTGGMDEIDP
jgi:hypothetical protein